MKKYEQWLNTANKYSGKAWWKIIEHLCFIYLLIIVFFLFLPSISIFLQWDKIALLHQSDIYLYRGILVINSYLFILITAIALPSYKQVRKIWNIARNFKKNLYYHGHTKSTRDDGSWTKPRLIWREDPPEC